MGLRCYPAWVFWYDTKKRVSLMGKKALYLLFLSPCETSWIHSKREAAMVLLPLLSDLFVAGYQTQGLAPIQVVQAVGQGRLQRPGTGFDEWA